MTEIERKEAELERDIDKWRVRRRISVAAFVHLLAMSVVLVAGGLMFDIAYLKDFTSVLIAFIGADMSILMTYIGSATYSDVKLGK